MSRISSKHVLKWSTAISIEDSPPEGVRAWMTRDPACDSPLVFLVKTVIADALQLWNEEKPPEKVEPLIVGRVTLFDAVAVIAAELSNIAKSDPVISAVPRFRSIEGSLADRFASLEKTYRLFAAEMRSRGDHSPDAFDMEIFRHMGENEIDAICYLTILSNSHTFSVYNDNWPVYALASHIETALVEFGLTTYSYPKFPRDGIRSICRNIARTITLGRNGEITATTAWYDKLTGFPLQGYETIGDVPRRAKLGELLFSRIVRDDSLGLGNLMRIMWNRYSELLGYTPYFHMFRGHPKIWTSDWTPFASADVPREFEASAVFFERYVRLVEIPLCYVDAPSAAIVSFETSLHRYALVNSTCRTGAEYDDQFRIFVASTKKDWPFLVDPRFVRVISVDSVKDVADELRTGVASPKWKKITPILMKPVAEEKVTAPPLIPISQIEESTSPTLVLEVQVEKPTPPPLIPISQIEKPIPSSPIPEVEESTSPTLVPVAEIEEEEKKKRHKHKHKEEKHKHKHKEKESEEEEERAPRLVPTDPRYSELTEEYNERLTFAKRNPESMESVFTLVFFKNKDTMLLDNSEWTYHPSVLKVITDGTFRKLACTSIAPKGYLSKTYDALIPDEITAMEYLYRAKHQFLLGVDTEQQQGPIRAWLQQIMYVDACYNGFRAIVSYPVETAKVILAVIGAMLAEFKHSKTRYKSFWPMNIGKTIVYIRQYSVFECVKALESIFTREDAKKIVAGAKLSEAKEPDVDFIDKMIGNVNTVGRKMDTDPTVVKDILARILPVLLNFSSLLRTLDKYSGKTKKTKDELEILSPEDKVALADMDRYIRYLSDIATNYIREMTTGGTIPARREIQNISVYLMASKSATASTTVDVPKTGYCFTQHTTSVIISTRPGSKSFSPGGWRL